MKMVSIICVICIGFISALAVCATPALAADSNGCWSGRHSRGPCLEYKTYQKNNKTYIILTNVCKQRLYMKWCAGNKCGSDSLRGGHTKKKYEYITNARVRAAAVGSNKSVKDWVCAGKVKGWNNL